MANKTKFEMTGLKETLKVFEDLQSEIGDKKSRSKVLIPAVKEAMKPVLEMAKSLAPVDTGFLKQSLRITAKRPSNKDKKSKYVKSNDSVIAVVTTKSPPKNGNKTFDMRAIAQEFGTANMPAQPFMRISLESQAGLVAQSLGEILKNKIEKYRSNMK